MQGASTKFNDDGISRLRKNLASWRVPAQLIDELIERPVEVSFPKGALVFSEGSSADLFACLLRGYVKLYCQVGDGSRTLMRLAGPGEVVGYADFIDARGRKARLFEGQSLSKCAVALITRDHVARLLRSMDASALLELMDALNTFWSLSIRWFATLIGMPFSKRLQIVLSDLATRVGVSDGRGVLLIPELRHEDLAEMIGCSRPMISRLIHEMIDDQLIAQSGKQYVLLQKWDFGGSQAIEGTPNGSNHLPGPLVSPAEQTARVSSTPRLRLSGSPRQSA